MQEFSLDSNLLDNLRRRKLPDGVRFLRHSRVHPRQPSLFPENRFPGAGEGI
jgi:hypothetical protein